VKAVENPCRCAVSPLPNRIPSRYNIGMRISPAELAERAHALQAQLVACTLCPHHCGVNRLAGEVGVCRVGAEARIASLCDHHGEEPAISGTRGSGTVFAAGCNLRCVYCQNHQISQGRLADAPVYTAAELADGYLRLQGLGVHNLNWVSPSHVVPQLVAALAFAVPRGYRLPIVYNSNGYDDLTTLALLEGIVDVYLPDLKYADARVGQQLSGVAEYPDAAIAAIAAMYRQVGDLALDDDGVAQRGVIVRHLVLPHGLAGSRTALRRLAEEVSPTITVSLMAQYYPAYHATGVPQLARRITAAEYEEALDAFAEAGLENGWAQDVEDAPETYRPDFRGDEHPFER
jgi:putative pyruvate formate lyase activating enzyme